MVHLPKQFYRWLLAAVVVFYLIASLVFDSFMLLPVSKSQQQSTENQQVASHTSSHPQQVEREPYKKVQPFNNYTSNQTNRIALLPPEQNLHGETKAVSTETVVGDDNNKPAAQNSKVDIAIFVNGFIPDETPKQARAVSIIQEQLTQIAGSYGGTQHPTIFVKPLGAANAIDQARLDTMCRDAVQQSNGATPLSCTLLPYPDSIKGGEIDTLTELHEYCLKHANTTQSRTTRVVYLHNKGSFHPSTENDNWRRSMTAATMTRECLDPPNASCTACGLLFASPARMFTNLFPGNMFAADCNYIAKLLPPRLFETRQGQMTQRALRLRQRGFFAFGPKDHRGWVVGAGRYAAEHWIGSHPHVTPCDVSKEPDYWHWENHVGHASEFEWHMFPRPTTVPMVVQPPNETDTRVKYFRLLAGHLFRHVFLYNATPPLDSWMYETFPDGAEWRACVHRFGNRVVEVVTEPEFNRSNMLAECAATSAV